jgi:hypothetical protein
MSVKLQAFCVEHGHAKVPRGYLEDLELANWVRDQRLEYANQHRGKNTRMTADPKVQWVNDAVQLSVRVIEWQQHLQD